VGDETQTEEWEAVQQGGTTWLRKGVMKKVFSNCMVRKRGDKKVLVTTLLGKGIVKKFFSCHVIRKRR
jgi:hypothetical protein